MQVSNSELQTFKQCRRRWWLAYYRRLKPIRDEATGAASVGTRVHACLALYYAPPVGRRKPVPEAKRAESALKLHDALVDSDCDRLPDDEESIRKEADLSRIMLEGYFDWLQETGADEGCTVVGSEHEVFVEVITPVTSTPVTFRGKLDLLVKREHEGDLMLKDHKTVQDFIQPTRTLHLDEQVYTYLWLMTQQGAGEVADGAVYNMLRKVKRTGTAKPPFYSRFEVRHTAQEVESFHHRLMGELEDLVGLRARLDGITELKGRKTRERALLAAVYPTPSRDCSWKCEFFYVCPFIDRPQDKRGEPLLAKMYEEHDPYQRYTSRGTDSAAE